MRLSTKSGKGRVDAIVSIASVVCLLLVTLLCFPASAVETNRVRRPLPPRIPPVATNGSVRAARSGQSRPLLTAARLAAVKKPSVVDVLVAYDQRAAMWTDWKGGGITNFAADAVARMNVSLTNSLISSALEFRLAGVVQVNAVAPTRWGELDFDAVLDDVTKGCGAWAVVSETRDLLGADVAVTLVDTGSEYGTTGLSWALCEESYENFADYAFSVCAVRAVATSHTMTHEVGHLFGAGHGDKQSSDPGPLLYGFSSGYYFETNGVACHTIMAYDDDGYGNYYEETPYFSSPNVSLAGVAVGTATNDNARTLRETASYVSSFRVLLADYGYTIRFEANGASLGFLRCRRDVVYALTCSGAVVRRPVGWACSNGKRYDDGVLVFNLAMPGETITMTEFVTNASKRITR